MSDYSHRLINALKKQHKELFDYEKGIMKNGYREEIKCPVCQSGRWKIKYRKDLFRFCECKNCGMIYLNPRMNENATYSFYNSEWNRIYNEKKFDSTREKKNFDDKRDLENLALIIKYKSDKGNLLEIGIGKGFFLKHALKKGFNVYGIELNKENCEKASNLLNDQGTIINNDLLSASLEKEMFDVVYMKDVFEHVPNPMDLLAEINRISKKGALVFIEVPNIEGAIYKIVKERHVTIFGFEHLNYWAPKTLSLALKENGYDICTIQHETDDFTIPYIIKYLFHESHTSLEKRKTNSLFNFILNITLGLFSIRPFNYLNVVSNRLVDKLKFGSQIKVIGLKR